MLRLNHWQVMWLMVMFDLPTATPSERKNASKFRNDLQCLGFEMFNYSVYVRPCITNKIADAQEDSVISVLPEDGKVCIIRFTDKQFGDMLIFDNAKPEIPPDTGEQLMLF